MRPVTLGDAPALARLSVRLGDPADAAANSA